MELQEIVSVALGTLIVIIIAHFSVFWVVRTLYPPLLPQPQQVVQPMPPQPQPDVFTTPVDVLQQDVTVPTYAPPVPVEAPREEGERKGPPPPEDTSIRGKPGVDAANTR